MALAPESRWTMAILLVAALLLWAPAAHAEHSHLSAQWHLDAGADGTTPDSSGHDLAGQDLSGSFAPGRFDNALTLAAANDGFRAPGTAVLEPQHLTVTAWVKGSGPFYPYRQIVGKGGGGCALQSYGLSTGESGSLWWNVALKGPADEQQVNVATASDAVAPEAIWNDQWHGVAGTFDGATADLWVDGAKVASTPVPEGERSVDYSVPERRLAVGRYPQDVDEVIGPCDPNGFQFHGAIDEVRIYNRALSAEEIARLQAADAAAPPDLPEAPAGPLAAPAPENVSKPEIRSGAEGEYTCDPGTWRNVAPDSAFSYRWLVVRGAEVQRVAETQEYRPDAASYGFPHACTVAVTGPDGPVTATSGQVFFTSAGLNTLPPPYGNVRIRGIDVFQVVQPNERAKMFGYKPDRAFFGLCGGGTPTNWLPSLAGGCRLSGRDPQTADYVGVTLDRYKAATAVVYVDMERAAAADPSLSYDLEVSATRSGGASLGAPVVVPVRNPPRTETSWVLPFERDGRDFGVHVRLPTAWTSAGGSIRLQARLHFPDRFAYGTAGYGVRECDDEPCEADDSFTLNDVPFADYPQLLIAALELRRSTAGQGRLPSARSVLARALTLFPGGSRMTVMPFQADLDITAASNFTATADPAPATTFTCNGATYNPPANASDPNDAVNRLNKATRQCRDNAVYAVALTWIRDHPGRRTVLRGSRISPTYYDVVMGVHDYDLPGGIPEPGSARNDITAVTASQPRVAQSTPFFTATSRTRPLTAAAHELGHILTAPHASTCNGATGTEPWPEVDRTLASDQGRLQSVKFVQAPIRLRGSTAPVVRSNATVDGPYTLAGGGLFNPQLFDLMSYCAGGDTANNDGTAWVSARSWNRFSRELAELGTRVGLDPRPRGMAAAAARAVARAATAVRTAFAVGVVGSEGGRIMRVVPPDGDDAVSGGDPSSPYAVRSLGPDGRVLLEAPVDVRGSSEAPDGQGGAFAGPVAANAVAVELLRDGTVLHRLERSRPPTVRLLAPRRGIHVTSDGSLQVRWQASDPDGGELGATVEFSPDGRTWRTVHDGPNDGRTTVPGTSLAAGRRARVRVSVSDGFAQQTVTSGAFSTDGPRPQVTIFTPQEGDLVRAGERLRLAGSALSALGRPLKGAALAWYAGDRRLGTGARLRARLPAGRTTLKLVARDLAGPPGQATLRLLVQPQQLRLIDLKAPAKVAARAGTVTVTVRASAPATLRAAGRRFRVGTRRTSLRVPLPVRPRVGAVRVPFRVVARDSAIKGTVRGTLTVVRT